MIGIEKIRSVAEGAFPINEEIAGIVPMAIPSEQEALTFNIQENGQREPVIIYKGAIVDGRCRQKALIMLGKNIIYKEIETTKTEEEVKLYVAAVNTRRNLTTTQKICVASRQYNRKDNIKTIDKIAKEWGVSRSSLNKANYIQKYNPKIFEALFNGKRVELDNNIWSDKIIAVYTYIRKATGKCTEKETSTFKALDMYYDKLKSDRAVELFEQEYETWPTTVRQHSECTESLVRMSNLLSDKEEQDKEKLQQKNNLMR